jgi:hypothetical protein
MAATSTGADLMSLLRFCTNQSTEKMALVVGGMFIQPRRELNSQRVCENTVVKVVKIGQNGVDDQEIEEEIGCEETRTSSIDGICNEILRIADVQFNILEGHRRGGMFYRSFLNDQSDTEESESEVEVTVCPPPLTKISEDPLPQWPSMSYESEEEDFENYSSATRSSSD